MLWPEAEIETHDILKGFVMRRGRGHHSSDSDSSAKKRKRHSR